VNVVTDCSLWRAAMQQYVQESHPRGSEGTGSRVLLSRRVLIYDLEEA
jgi:hypothetical protein